MAVFSPLIFELTEIPTKAYSRTAKIRKPFPQRQCSTMSNYLKLISNFRPQLHLHSVFSLSLYSYWSVFSLYHNGNSSCRWMPAQVVCKNQATIQMTPLRQQDRLETQCFLQKQALEESKKKATKFKLRFTGTDHKNLYETQSLNSPHFEARRLSVILTASYTLPTGPSSSKILST